MPSQNSVFESSDQFQRQSTTYYQQNVAENFEEKMLIPENSVQLILTSRDNK
jgi:hypothetical protein